MPLSSSPNLALGMASGSQVGGGRLRASEHWKRATSKEMVGVCGAWMVDEEGVRGLCRWGRQEGLQLGPLRGGNLVVLLFDVLIGSPKSCEAVCLFLPPQTWLWAWHRGAK